MIHVIGIGLDGRKSLLKRPLEIIEKAALLVGGKRHLDAFPDVKARKVAIGSNLEEAATAIRPTRSRGLSGPCWSAPGSFGECGESNHSFSDPPRQIAARE